MATEKTKKYGKTGVEIFNNAYLNADRVIPYNPAWANGTGYNDGVVHDHTVGTIGEILAVMDLNYEGQPRKAIIMVTPWGNLMVFERHQSKPGVYVASGPDVLGRLLDIACGEITSEAMELLFCDGERYSMRQHGFLANVISLVANTGSGYWAGIKQRVDMGGQRNPPPAPRNTAACGGGRRCAGEDESLR